VNAYAVCIPEERVEYSYMEPPEPGVPLGIFVAETAGQAKVDALRAWTQRRMGVNTDDFTAIRARNICSLSVGERGEVKDPTDVLWILWPDRWPEI
jgi:hypothetical protein